MWHCCGQLKRSVWMIYTLPELEEPKQQQVVELKINTWIKRCGNAGCGCYGNHDIIILSSFRSLLIYTSQDFGPLLITSVFPISLIIILLLFSYFCPSSEAITQRGDSPTPRYLFLITSFRYIAFLRVFFFFSFINRLNSSFLASFSTEAAFSQEVTILTIKKKMSSYIQPYSTH